MSFRLDNVDDSSIIFSDSFENNVSNGYVYDCLWNAGPKIKELSPDLISTDESHSTVENLENSGFVENFENSEDRCDSKVEMSENSVSIEFDSLSDVQSENQLRITSVNNDNKRNHMVERHVNLKKFLDSEFKVNHELTGFTDVSKTSVHGSVVSSEKRVDTYGAVNVWTNFKGIFSNRFKVNTRPAIPKVVFDVEDSDVDSRVTNSGLGKHSGSSTGVVQKSGRDTGYRRSISCDPLASGETVLRSTEPVDIKYSDENFPMKVCQDCI